MFPVLVSFLLQHFAGRPWKNDLGHEDKLEPCVFIAVSAYEGTGHAGKTSGFVNWLLFTRTASSE